MSLQVVLYFWISLIISVDCTQPAACTTTACQANGDTAATCLTDGSCSCTTTYGFVLDMMNNICIAATSCANMPNTGSGIGWNTCAAAGDQGSTCHVDSTGTIVCTCSTGYVASKAVPSGPSICRAYTSCSSYGSNSCQYYGDLGSSCTDNTVVGSGYSCICSMEYTVTTTPITTCKALKKEQHVPLVVLALIALFSFLGFLVHSSKGNKDDEHVPLHYRNRIVGSGNNLSSKQLERLFSSLESFAGNAKNLRN